MSWRKWFTYGILCAFALSSRPASAQLESTSQQAAPPAFGGRRVRPAAADGPPFVHPAVSEMAISAAVGPRPHFQLPFPCGQQWRLDTWAHAPALDMVREPNQVGTEGALLIAPADGVVNQSFRHANAGNMIQIDHGGRWFTTYIHLQSRAVSVGQRVVQGQSIGLVGKDGPTSNGHPHLHFELAIDANGDGRATWGAANTERVRPWFNGVEYGQSNGQTWRNTTSNNCAPPPAPTVVIRGQLGDFDGDGKRDIAGVAHSDLWIHRNTSTPGQFSTRGEFVTTGWLTVSKFMAGDFDDDGKADIIGFNGGDELMIWRSTSTSERMSFAPFQSLGTGWSIFSHLLPLADYDGDGKLDIAGVAHSDLWIHRNTSTPGQFSTRGQFVTTGWLTVSKYLGADFDIDGKADVIGFNGGDQLMMWRSQSTAAQMAFDALRSFGTGWGIFGHLITSAAPR
jgi:hypothetical protein